MYKLFLNVGVIRFFNVFSFYSFSDLKFYSFYRLIHGVIVSICLLFIRMSLQVVLSNNPLPFNFVLILWRCVDNLTDLEFLTGMIDGYFYTSISLRVNDDDPYF